MAALVQPATHQLSSQDALPEIIDKSLVPTMDVKGTKSNAPRTRKPNYAQIHTRPIPVHVHPLPAFLPHNPLSIVRIAVALLSHSLWPPTSHEIVHKAYFSTETHSLHVTDHKSIRALWEHGFWGAGSLSRSEPRWLDQEKRKRGIEASQTSEEFTRKRREERRQFKLERAKVQRETIEQQLRDEGKLDVPNTVVVSVMDGHPVEISNEVLNAAEELVDETTNLTAHTGVLESVMEDRTQLQPEVGLDVAVVEIQDQEHLQLTPEEAFFLTYSLGALQVYRDKTLLPPSYLFRLYCAYSTFPIPEEAELHLYSLFRLRERLNRFALGSSAITPIVPDNSFILRYAVYHHFRSLGWVVRHGVKFACDFLLYQRGPVFAHAKFAVIIVPSYSHSYWSETPERKAETEKKETRDWWWLHRVN